MKRTIMKRAVILAAGLLAVMALMAGCGKVTAKGLLKEAVDNTAKAKSYSGKAIMDMEMGVESSGVSMGMKLNADLKLEAVNKQEAMYANGTINIDLLNMSLKTEMYTVKEDGKSVAYMKMGDQWKKSSVSDKEKDSKDAKKSAVEMFADMKEDKLTLEKKTVKVNKKDAYVIKTKLKGEDFKEELKDMDEYLEKAGLKDVDASKLAADVTIKIYKGTKLPASVSVKITDGLEDMISGIMKQTQADANFKMDRCEIKLQFDSYDTVDKITVPKEALESAEGIDAADSLKGTSDKPDAPAQGDDGYYDLKSYDGDATAKVKTPEGFTLNDYADNTYLTFMKTIGDNNGDITFSYTVEKEYSDIEEDMVKYQQDDKAYYEGDEEYSDLVFKDLQTIDVGSLKVSYLLKGYTFDGTIYSQEIEAWTVLQDGRVLQCTIDGSAYESASDLMEETAAVNAAFSAVQP